jgi:hypothetical protein
MKLRSFILASTLFAGITAMAMPESVAPISYPIARLEMHGPVVPNSTSHFITIFDDGTVKRDNLKIATITTVSELVSAISMVDPKDGLQDIDAGKPATVGGGARVYEVFQGLNAPILVGNVKGAHRRFLSQQYRFSQRMVDILDGFAALAQK